MTAAVLSGSFLIIYIYIGVNKKRIYTYIYIYLNIHIYIFVFSSYVSLIPFNMSRFILYQDMENLVLDIMPLNTDEFVSILGVFMPSSLPN